MQRIIHNDNNKMLFSYLTKHLGLTYKYIICLNNQSNNKIMRNDLYFCINSIVTRCMMSFH